MSKIKQYMAEVANTEPTSNVEIERKFLVTNDSWKKAVVESFEIYQMYISTSPAVRVRTIGRKATLTIKSANEGMTRNEFEYDIPYQDAVEMISVFGDLLITKIRHIVVDFETCQRWEIDEFRGYNSGLVIAEIELASEDEKVNTNHAWLGDEVTDNQRYYNSWLFTNPYKNWD